MPTRDECKRILSRVGLKLGVSPNLISSRLLDPYDKELMLSGEVTFEILCVATKMWMDAAMPDYANGCAKRMKNTKE